MLLKPMLIVLMILSLTRLGLVAWQLERVQEADGLGFIFLQGLRFDLVLLGMILLIPATLTPLMAINVRLLGLWKRLMCVYLTVWVIIIVFMEVSTPSFINQYDSRPNYIFVEYLQHYKEVASTLIAQYPLQLLLAGIVVPLAAVSFYRYMKRTWLLEAPLHWPYALALMPVILITCAMMVRSSLGHRPVNPSTVAISPDGMVNDLALNSTYTVAYAIYLTKDDEHGGVSYGEMDRNNMLQIIHEEMLLPDTAFISPEIPTLHRQQAGQVRERPYNLVIILEESLGAEFVGALGGLPLTPNLDRLSREGIWFSNIYATGTRSVRGIEAVVTGFTPTSTHAVVKLNKSQRGFFTLAALLRERGFDTGFMYGGESHFDNMRGFFMGNGFNYVIDGKDYANPVFTGSWGVSDEDLFNRAHEKFSSYSPEQPFFALVFTSTNHSPFEFPDGRIELHDPEKNTVNNAVKYADHALGEFIDRARRSRYWDNTLFLIIADHNSRVYGNSLVPIEHFHIPSLILGGGIKPKTINILGSQIDMGPTLLPLMGISSEHPMIGRDLLRPELGDVPGRAIMQFNTIQAYMEGEQVVLLRPEMAPETFVYEHNTLTPQRSDASERLIDKALAHALFTKTAYDEQLYRIPSE
ncbi:MAG: hypothetical protein A2V90_07460 [Gammaproteobacteria bacterium RBG_16_57_12]|nr:MAG: hypothetical protein A2V90_07460 [Gammaproteobacteria bacterium RBG_16_57_12]